MSKAQKGTVLGLPGLMRNLPLTLQVEESRSEAVKARPIYSNTTLFVALTAVFTALTAVVTLTIRIPFPATAGYFNLGDALVMLSGILIGPIGGFIAGGLGSALADLVGYPHFAPVTLIVKGCEGLIVGLFSHSGRARRIGVRDVAGLVLGAAAMLLGYLAAETLIYGFEAALSELVFVNSIQVAVGAVVAVVVGTPARIYLNRAITG